MDHEPEDHVLTPLSRRLVAYYREVVALHADDPVVGACLVCRVSRCKDWRHATDRLWAAYEDPDAVVPPRNEAQTSASPLRAGDVIQLAGQSRGHALGGISLRVTVVHGVVYLDDGPYLLAQIARLGEDDEPRYAQLRIADIRFITDSGGPGQAA